MRNRASNSGLQHILAGAVVFMFCQAGCICPQEECFSGSEGFAACVYPNSPEDHTNNPSIVFGASNAAGGWCFEKDGVKKCGFIQKLEELTGEEISNFSLPGHTTFHEIETDFARTNESLAMNPNAKRVYLCLGGAELIHFLVHNPQLLQQPDCQLGQIELLMLQIVENLRSIILHYKENGIREIVVGSYPPVDETATNLFSCYSVMLMYGMNPASQGNRCLNHMLDVFSAYISNLVDDLGGQPSGYYFADHFHEFPPNPGQCAYYCDCFHPNCTGHDLMAHIWYEALPSCLDNDSDGYYLQSGCGTAQDCVDTDPNVNPGAAEVCDDGKDNDCDNLTDGTDPDCQAPPEAG